MKKTFLAVLFSLLVFPIIASASTVVLQWNPNVEIDLAGYKVHYSNTNVQPFAGTGATQGASGTIIIPKGSTTATVSALDPTKTYYFAVTAYNTSNMVSPYSNIVTVPPFPAIPGNLRIVTIVATP